MRRLPTILTSAALFALPIAAQGSVRPLPPAKQAPTLVVFITVDQMRPDYLDRFAPQLTGGLGRLLRGGAVFTNAMLDYATTETAPGHATGMSGRFPRSTGIVSNSMGVYDPPTGTFTTSTYYAAALPAWLDAFNARRLPAQQAGHRWTLLLPDSAYAEPDSVVYENFGNDFTFPHALPADSAAAARALPDMPYMDELTLQVALTGVKQLNLGTGTWTDVVAVSLSTTDAVGHRYGPQSREMHDQILRLDRALGAFFDSLFTVRDPSRVVIALTADHAVAPIPEEYVAQEHKPAQRVDLSSVARRADSALAARGADPMDFQFEDGMLYVHREALARAGVNADSVISAFRAEIAAMPGVQRVYARAELARDTLKDPAARRWYHSIPPDYPVELVVVLRPYSVFGTYAPAIHGSPYDYDNHVPMLLYGAAVKAGRYDAPTLLVDLAPTLAWITATVPADRVDGTVLWTALK